jgi:ABC-type glycerol-3-phosphate transport system substrate-binding protein
MRRILFPTLLLFVLMLSLAGCGAPPTQGPLVADQPAAPADAAAAPAAAAPAADAPAEPPPTATPVVSEFGSGGQQLIFWNGLTGADGVTMQAMVEDFVAANPDISVRVEAMPWNIYFDKLLTSMVSGSPPDVFIVREFENAGFARQGVLRDSSDLYVSGGGTLPDDDFKPELLGRLDYEGVRYGVPLDNLGWGTWINRDLFTAAGLDPDSPPASGDELVAMARKLTVDVNGVRADEEGFDSTQVAQWGIAINNPKNTYQTALWQFGGDVFQDGTAMLDQQPALDAMNFLTGLIYEEHVSPPPAGFDALQAFGAGQLAILPYGTWGLNFMKGSGINWDVWPMVQFGPEPAARMSSHVLHMPNTLEGDRLEAATRLVTYLSDNGLKWAGSGQVPARYSVQEQLDPEADRAVLVFADSFNRQGRLETPHPLKQEIAAAWEPEIDGAWNQVAAPEDALQTANQRVREVLDRAQ